MSQRIASSDLAAVAAVSDAPVRTRVDRTFGLPKGLYVATVGLYLAFLALMTALFHNSELLLPMSVIVGSVIFGFGLAGRWASMKPGNESKPLTWGQFSHRGIQTLSGPLTAFEASVQVLILPVLLMFWGLSIAVIAATVG
ncbi:MAG: hypothetical protein AB7F98_02210 [Novosphingobium sp.]